MTALLTEQDRHEAQRRLDELEELGIRPHEHDTTFVPESGLWCCVTCPAAFDSDGREIRDMPEPYDVARDRRVEVAS